MTSSTSLPKWADPARIPPNPPEYLAARLATLREIKPQDLAAWRHHPVSRLVLQFLADYRDELLRDAITSWFGGGLTATQEGEGRGRAMLAAELVEINYDQLLRFYGVQPAVEEVSAE